MPGPYGWLLGKVTKDGGDDLTCCSYPVIHRPVKAWQAIKQRN
jgi:hypothetical protein